MQVNSLGFWTDDDFELPAHTQIEEDPWDTTVVVEEPVPSVEVGTELLSIGASPAYEVENSLQGSDLPNDWSKDEPESESDATASDELDPTAEFDPELSESLYGQVEEINLTDVDIRLDHFLSRFTLSDEQSFIIRDHLTSFSQARLSNWLPWLNSKDWTPQMLTSFVQFHSHWETMPVWWESWWYRRSYGWRVKLPPMANILSRDDAYQIVSRRINCAAQDIVDDDWFDEWNYYSMWRHGFWSFAKFAKFRAALNGGEEWFSLIEWADLDSDIETMYQIRDMEIIRQSILEKAY